MRGPGLAFFVLILKYLIPLVSPGGHALVIAPIKLRIPFNGLIGLAALKVAKLSLATAVLSKGHLKILKSARRKISKKTVYPHPPRILPPSFAKLHPIPGFNPWAPSFPPTFGFQGSSSFHHPTFANAPFHPPIGIGSFPPHFGPPGLPTFSSFGPRPGPSFGGFGPRPGPSFGPPKLISGPLILPPSTLGGIPPPYIPPPPRPPPVPEYLKSKLVQPKDACILKLVCEFEFHPNKLGGGQLESMLLGMSSPISKKTSYFRRRRRDTDDDNSFWINIKKVPRDEKVGSEICENRYPSCNFSPIFKFSKRSGEIEPIEIPVRNSRLRKFVEEVRDRMKEWTEKLRAL